MSKVEEKGSEEGRDGYTEDGTVNLRGQPILRSKTGRWRACIFITVYEVFERMAFYGISSNLVVFLSTKLHEGTVTSSNNVTNWSGTVWFLPILGAYIADAHLGRYWTVVIASLIYLLGMCLVTLAVSLPALRPPSCGQGIKEEECGKRATTFQLAFFYCSLYIIAIGSGGTKPNISTMGADQFDDFEPKEREQKLSFFNWWMFSAFFGGLCSDTFLVYIQDNVGWSTGYAIPTVGLAVSIAVFLMGTPIYRHKLPAGSPFTKMAQVLVAAIRKWKIPIPENPEELYEQEMEESSKPAKYSIEHSSTLRFLDKAAVTCDSTSPWMRCPRTQVEETKQMLKMLPVLAITFIPSTVSAQISTLFIKQGTTLDRSMGPHFRIPSACLTAFVPLFMLITMPIYDRLFVPFIRRYTKNPRGISLLQRMGIGLVFHCIVMLTAGLSDRTRLAVAREHNTLGRFDVVPLTIFFLLPQFALMGVADVFFEVAKIEFFYDQAPEGMKSLGSSYFCISVGSGNFLSSVLLKIVANLTKKHGHQGWILDNLNISHLDYYYAFLGILSFLNLLVFLVVAKNFTYNVDVDSRKDIHKEDMDSLAN